MTRSKFFAIAAVASAVAFLMAFDASAGRGRGQGRRGTVQRMTAALELTAEQQVAIQKLRAELIEDLAPAKAKLTALREQMRALWQADNPNEKKILAKHAEMDTYRKQIRDRQIEFRLDVLGVLTVEQRAKLQQLKADRGADRTGKRGGKRGGQGRGAR